MSITSTFSNAASGLAASARAVQVASANLANAMTPGYGPRQLDLAASTLGGTGGGVRILGATRQVDVALLGLVRDSGADAAASSGELAFWNAVETALGPQGRGLPAALAALDAALVAAAHRPDLESRLSGVVERAEGLAAALVGASTAVQAQRAAADSGIARDVEALNDGLARLDALNDRIVHQRSGGQSTLGLEDERQALITRLAQIVPMREHLRHDGRIALFSAGGELLLDLEPARFGFDPAPVVEAGSAPGAGLSGLSLRGRPVDPGPDGPLGGGRLAAAFQIRDVAGPGLQAGLDDLARGLVARFADPQTDPTLAPGAPGLFTDAQSAAGMAPGLAARIEVNAAVVPAAGGAPARLRDGLGAPSPAEIGDATRLAALGQALQRPQALTPGARAQSLAEDVASLLTATSTRRQFHEDASVAATARSRDLEGQVLEQGVDTDAEIQRLMLIEQAYAANARVIETADAMLRRLLEI